MMLLSPPSRYRHRWLPACFWDPHSLQCQFSRTHAWADHWVVPKEETAPGLKDHLLSWVSKLPEDGHYGSLVILTYWQCHFLMPSWESQSPKWRTAATAPKISLIVTSTFFLLVFLSSLAPQAMEGGSSGVDFVPGLIWKMKWNYIGVMYFGNKMGGKAILPFLSQSKKDFLFLLVLETETRNGNVWDILFNSLWVVIACSVPWELWEKESGNSALDEKGIKGRLLSLYNLSDSFHLSKFNVT